MKRFQLKNCIAGLLSALLVLSAAGCSGSQETAQQPADSAAASQKPGVVSEDRAQGGEASVADPISEYVDPIIDALAEGAGLAPLSADVTMRPIGMLYDVQTEAAFEDGAATFTYRCGEEQYDYIVDLNREKVQRGVIEVLVRRNGGDAKLAVTDAGTSYLNSAGKNLSVRKLAEAAQVDLSATFERESGHLLLDYTETLEGVSTHKRFDFFLSGKSLVVHATSPDQNGKNGYSGFTAGGAHGLDAPRIDSSMYTEEVSVTILDDSWFLSAYLDKAKTFATRLTSTPGADKTGTVHGMTASYELNSAGHTNPLNELLYVTASDQFLDCTYRSNGERSAYCDMLNELVVYDNWNFTTTYNARKYNLLSLCEDYGLRDMLLVEHRWQRDTLDISNPAFYPASTKWGSAQEFADYITTVMDRMGWRLALHEDYWFMQPSRTNQYWNVDGVEDLLAQTADGTLRLGWQDTSYANKSDMMAYYAGIESRLIKDNYQTDASFLDVNGGVDPSLMNQVTLNAGSSTSRTLAQVVADNVMLFQTMRDIYNGPIISEGAQSVRSIGSLYAGFLESSSREITDCNQCRIMPDYELTHVRTRMANQGMGPPARFQPDGDLQTYDFDKYNAAAIAYGHTGFIGDTHYASPLLQDEIINAYYMFRALQPQYLSSSVGVQQIEYYDLDGTAMDLNAAVLSGYDFRASRLHIVYSNGLEIYLNFGNENWAVELNGHAYLLDKNGFAAENPQQDFVEYSCLRDGVRADYVSCGLYTYANPRGEVVDFGDGLITNRMTIRCADGFEVNASAPVLRDAVKFTELVGEENGENGFTYYYTDGTQLTPFTEYDEAEGKWVHGDKGVLIYPALIPGDNYGVAGSSDAEYVVLGYKVTESGRADLSAWTVLQGPAGKHGYRVKVAVGSLDNVVDSYELSGETQTADEQTFTFKVEAGQEVYVIYEPLVQADNEWFGYINSIAITALADEA